MDKVMYAKIQNKLKEIEKEQAVEVLIAAESGSRGRGIESPDSDDDCRFIYRKHREMDKLIF